MNQFPRPVEVYKNSLDPEDLDSFGVELELNILSSLDGIGERSLVDFMDDLRLNDRYQWNKSAAILAKLPSDVILENYGEEALIWAAISGLPYDETRHNSKLEDIGYNLSFLEKSKDWCGRSREPNRTAAALSQYNLGLGLMNGELLNSDILPFQLQQAAREGIEIDKNRAGHYRLEPIISSEPKHYDGYVRGSWDKDPDIYCPIWLDAPFGIALTYKGLPQTIVSFAVSSNKELLIRQLQGATAHKVRRDDEGRRVVGERKSARGLPVLDWQRLMVNVTAQVAAGMGLETVGIQEAKKNYWTRRYRDEEEPRLPIEKAIQMYDQTAERLGFQRHEDGDWHVDVEKCCELPVAALPAITHQEASNNKLSKAVKWLAGLVGKNQSAS